MTATQGTDVVSIAARLRELAATAPDQVLYTHLGLDGVDREVTNAELSRRAHQVAAVLADRGVGVGHRVSIGLRNSPEFAFCTFACWLLGATPVPVRWDLPEWELERVRRVIDATVDVDAGSLGWIAATAGDEPREFPDAISPSLNGICSSGSTGTPKVILRGDQSVYSPLGATPFMAAWDPTTPRPQRILVPAPMYHTNGFATFSNLLGGDPLFVMEKFDAARVVDAIERHRITNFTATPTMLQRIADLPGVDHRDLSSIVWILQGAAVMPPSLVHRWGSLIGIERIVMAYGMTEGLGLTAIRGDEWLTHQGSVGRGFRGAELRILDDEQRDLPAREIGEIYLRSPTAWGYHYLGDAKELRTTPDGFSTAGDLGWLDEEGFLYIVDRRVDMIISGGANVFPAEVETALIDHPQIADVVVVGLQDPEWGRRVHAIVEPADPAAPPSADEVIRYAKTKLAAYKVPKTVEIVDAIPRSAATKVNRAALVNERGG